MRGGGRRRPGAKLSTDPQSVAARERRHRISDRFRVLRSLVPGGSKMDTAALVQHEEGCQHADVAAAFSAADADLALELNHRHGGAGDDDAGMTTLEMAPMQEAVGYGDGPAHQMMQQALDPAGQLMMGGAHQLPPLPCCVFVQETDPSCYSVCNVHGEESGAQGSY
ncbi:hypothetical protein OsJ_03959 [Oryza sativa Japonica Group]|uniref:BHLH domain-containing protein n=1 Tax=Oryza sativa subsp. japonica TaxID=39947 RepID=B9EUA0_ORYSJ|nr:hypothetical protein OsJ_03959 [Oryza sativa Japonica Group]